MEPVSEQESQSAAKVLYQSGVGGRDRFIGEDVREDTLHCCKFLRDERDDIVEVER